MYEGIIANPEVLEEDYVPPTLPCREVQKKELAFCLSPIEKGLRPSDCLCYGKPGTGKTALVKHILEQIQDYTNCFAFYVNCWENKTLNQILENLAVQANVFVTESSYSAKISRLKQKIKNKPCVIALDEIDKIERKELNDILYILKQMGKVGLICISNTREYVIDLDPRILSRIRFKSIRFPPYSNEELLIILRHRIIECKALFPGTYSKDILEKIADLAAGDARIAIQTLRNAAYNAERKGKRRIEEDDVKQGFEEISEIKRKYMLQKLSEHHRLIYQIIKKNPGITSRELTRTYISLCQKAGLTPKSKRSLSNYVSTLLNLHLIWGERVRTRGNVRKFFTGKKEFHI